MEPTLGEVEISVMVEKGADVFELKTHTHVVNSAIPGTPQERPYFVCQIFVRHLFLLVFWTGTELDKSENV